MCSMHRVHYVQCVQYVQRVQYVQYVRIVRRTLYLVLSTCIFANALLLCMEHKHPKNLFLPHLREADLLPTSSFISLTA